MIHYFDFHVNATSLQFNFVTLTMTSEQQLAITYNAKYHIIIECYRKVYIFFYSFCSLLSMILIINIL